MDYMLWYLNTYLNHNQLKSDLGHIREFYRKEGYSLLNFKDIEFDSISGRLIVEIDEGIIDLIEIEGNRITDKLVILREFPLSKGEVFNSYLVISLLDYGYNLIFHYYLFCIFLHFYFYSFLCN